MKNKKIMIVILFLIFVFTNGLYSQSSCYPPKDNGRPGGDNPDDNYSYFKTEKYGEFRIYPDYIIYKRGEWKTWWNAKREMYKNRNRALTDFENLELVKQEGVIVLPTGSLFSHQNDLSLKETLKQYVSNGGTIVVFAQQYGRHVENIVPIPDGERLKIYGWREDQSCLNGSVYTTGEHHVISSLKSDRASVAVDGYIDEYPQNSVILLRRISNRKPALLYYKYGKGTVILTTMYTDWGYAHSQASSEELKIVRDLLTFARDTESEIPMYNITETANPKIKLNLKLRNDTDYDAVKARIRVLNPSMSKVVFEKEVSVNIEKRDKEKGKDGEGDIAYEIVFDNGIEKELGIWHTEYELYDSEGRLIKMREEAESGRFSLYKNRWKYELKAGIEAWLTMRDEEVWWKEDAVFELHIKNFKDKEVELDLEQEIVHRGKKPLFKVRIGAGEMYTKEIRVSHDMGSRYWIYIRGGGIYKIISKGYRIEKPKFNSKIVIEGGGYQKYGGVLRYRIEGVNESKRKVGVKYRVELRGGGIEKVLKEEEREIDKGGRFEYEGSYDLKGLKPGKKYELRYVLELENGEKIVRRKVFSVNRSNVSVNIDGDVELEVEKDNKIKIVIRNGESGKNDSFLVENGRLEIEVSMDKGGEIAYKGEVKDIRLEPGEVKEIEHVLRFKPKSSGRYSVKLRYYDETRDKTGKKLYKSVKIKRYDFGFNIYKDKEKYSYRDKAKVRFEIRGYGEFKLRIRINNGEEIEKELKIDEGSDSVLYVMEVPIEVINRDYVISGEVESKGWVFYDEDGSMKKYKERKWVVLRQERADVGVWSEFAKIGARIGEPLRVKVGVKGISGFSGVLSGRLRVISDELGYDKTKDIVIEPVGEKTYDYEIGIGSDKEAGRYEVGVILEVEGRVFYDKSYFVRLEEAKIEIEGLEEREYKFGDKIELGYKNVGGKDGEYEIREEIYDVRGVRISERNVSEEIRAGEVYRDEIEIEGGLKSGEYRVYREVREKNTNKIVQRYDKIRIKGLSGKLRTYTEKERYFVGEDIRGKTEIEIGGGEIEGGKLKVKVRRSMEIEGEVLLREGRFSRVNVIKGGVVIGDKFYFISNEGFVEYEEKSNSFKILNKEINKEGVIYKDKSGEIWIGIRGEGLYRMKREGEWIRYGVSEGIISNNIRDIIGYDKGGDNRILVGTDKGISVYLNGSWSNYTRDKGLKSDNVYKFAKDKEGGIWISSEGGMMRYDGEGFDDISVPFGSESSKGLMTNNSDGEVWMVVNDKVYRRKGSDWKNWDLKELIGKGVKVKEIKGDDNDVWLLSEIRGGATVGVVEILVRFYEGGEEVFRGGENDKIEGLRGIIRKAGEGVIFNKDFGYLKYSDNKWEEGLIEIDTDKLLGYGIAMKRIEGGKLIISTRGGLSIYNGEGYENKIRYKNGEIVGYVREFVIKGDEIYVLGENEIRVIKGEEERIVDLKGMDVMRMGVDSVGRIWVIYVGEAMGFEYYENGEWKNLNGLNVSYGSRFYNSSDGIYLLENDKIVHIKGDKSIVKLKYPVEIERIYEIRQLLEDKNGSVWLLREKRGSIIRKSKNGNKMELYVYEGGSWKDYGIKEGYPAEGFFYMCEGERGEKYFVAKTEEGVYDIYEYTGEGFEKKGYEFKSKDYYLREFVESGGYFYVMEGEKGGERGILRIGGKGGVYDEVVWSKEYDVEGTGVKEIVHDIDSKLGAGVYVISGKLTNGKSQEIGESEYEFEVRDKGLNVLIRSKEGVSNKVMKGEEVLLEVVVNNNGEEDKSGLKIEEKVVYEDGREEKIGEKEIDIEKGGEYAEEIRMEKEEVGVYKIVAEVREGEEFLSVSEYFVEVIEPKIELKTEVPKYVGDEEFVIKAIIKNIGDIPFEINFSVNEVGINESLRLDSGEERMVEFKDRISKDERYEIEISGDVEKREEIEVKYGYRDEIEMNILSEYREGEVEIGYELKESEGMSFKEKIYFKLYVMGSSTPLYEYEKSYNIYPGKEGIKDSIRFKLGAGKYVLKYKKERGEEEEREINVIRAGIGKLEFKPELKYPVGDIEFGYKLKNIDSVSGDLGIEIVLRKGGKEIYKESRSYYMKSGEERDDRVEIKGVGEGNYELEIRGEKLKESLRYEIKVLPFEKYDSVIDIGDIEDNNVGIRVGVKNSGYKEFNGGVVVKVDKEMKINDDMVVNGGEEKYKSYDMDTEFMSVGEHEVDVILYDERGERVKEEKRRVRVEGGDIEVIDYSKGLEIEAGGYGELRIKLRNKGNKTGNCKLRVRGFEILDEEYDIELRGGEEKEIEGIYVDVGEDVSEGEYEVRYEIEGEGVKGGKKRGVIGVKVKGIKLEVESEFDKAVYNVGDEAELMIRVKSNKESKKELKVIVNWGEYTEEKEFVLEGLEKEIRFLIPIDKRREEKVFYGIYYVEGKGIYLNDKYIEVSGDKLFVVTDKDLYKSGDEVIADFVIREGRGKVRAELFGEEKEFEGSNGRLVFRVPEGSLGGTYSIEWEYEEEGGSIERGSKRIDVEGLVVKTAEAVTDRSKYNGEDEVEVSYGFESNEDVVLKLRNWLVKPSGEWDYLGEREVYLEEGKISRVVSKISINSEELGLHKIMYGLYREEELVVSGSLSIVCGDVMLMGVMRDRSEYERGDEEVRIKVEILGEGRGELVISLDDKEYKEGVIYRGSEEVEGYKEKEIRIGSDKLKGGRHRIYAKIEEGGMRSEKSYEFDYGVGLSDLIIDGIERNSDGLRYVYRVRVMNRGRGESKSCDLRFSVDGVEAGRLVVNGMKSGEYAEYEFEYNGKGKAGEHEMEFYVDSNNVVKEYDEDNNSYELSEYVEEIFYDLKVEPEEWVANEEVLILSKVMNNRGENIKVNMKTRVESNESGVVVYEKEREVELPSYNTTILEERFNTGVNVAGEYVVVQKIEGEGIEREKEKYVILKESKDIDVVCNVKPDKVSSGMESEVNIGLEIRNVGNVDIENDELKIVIEKEGGEEVKEKVVKFGLVIGEKKEKKESMLLNLEKGKYYVVIKYAEKEKARVEFESIEGISEEVEIDEGIKVLLMNVSNMMYYRSKMYIKREMRERGIDYVDGGGFFKSNFEYMKGESNVNIIFGRLVERDMLKEIMERVYRGEGLILVDSGVRDLNMIREITGVEVRGLKRGEKEVKIEGGGSYVLKRRLRRVISKVLNEDVRIAARSKKKGYGVISERRYGKGYVVLILHNLEFKREEGFGEFIIRELEKIRGKIYKKSGIERVVPIRLRIKNNSEEKKKIELVVEKSYGVELSGYKPEPDNKREIRRRQWNIKIKIKRENKKVEYPRWEMEIEGGGEKEIRYWARLDDKIGNYVIRNRIKEKGGEEREVEIMLEVNELVRGRISRLIKELEIIEANGKDKRYIEESKRRLEKILRRNEFMGEELMSFMNLRDSVKAGMVLGKVKGVKVKKIRREIGDLILVYSRRIYELIKDMGLFNNTDFFFNGIKN